MIPKVNGRGHSFKGIAAYLMNPTDDMSPDQERVTWSETGNMLTDDIELAAKVMAWTDMHAEELKLAAGISNAGAKPSTGAVYHYSLAWALSEAPEPEHMKAAALETLVRLGLADHEYFMVGHGDREHSHLHVVANLTNPETGKRAELGLDYVTLQKWALEYEREHGIHCQVREDNAMKRGEGQAVKYRDQKQDYSTQVTRAFHLSDNGQSFVAALEMEGLQIAPARRGKGFVIIDQKGDIQKLGRQLSIDEKGKEKTAAINAKLADLDRDSLGDADQIAAKIKESRAPDRELSEVDQQNDMLDGAEEAAKLAAKIEAEERAEKKRLAEEKHQQAIAARLEDMELRQTQEVVDLEERLSKGVGGHLRDAQDEAEKFRGYVEGKGLKLSLRRLWRGKKDQEILAELRGDIDQMQATMETARKELSSIHDRERAEIEKLRDQKFIGYKDRTAKEKQAHLEKQMPQPQLTAKARKSNPEYEVGFHSDADFKRHKQLAALHGRIGHQERQSQKEASTERKLLADRARADVRRQELNKQKTLSDRAREAREQMENNQIARQESERVAEVDAQRAAQWEAEDTKRQEETRKSLADRAREAGEQFEARKSELDGQKPDQTPERVRDDRDMER